ncbi:MAG: CPBP family intramembrane glutamic endopeptidase [Bacillota bacterium]|nr:CPBP family intramembrane glutamic endopeptidase [Bacillota bacterium]
MKKKGENGDGRSGRRWLAFLLTGILAPLFLNLVYLPRIPAPFFPGTALYGITTLMISVVMPFVLYACCGMLFPFFRRCGEDRENGCKPYSDGENTGKTTKKTTGENAGRTAGENTGQNTQKSYSAVFRKAYTLRNFSAGMRGMIPVFVISAGTVLFHISSRTPLRTGEDLFCALTVTAVAAALTEEAAFRVFAIRLCMNLLSPVNKGEPRRNISGGKACYDSDAERAQASVRTSSDAERAQASVRTSSDAERAQASARISSDAERAQTSVWISAAVFALVHAGNLFSGQPVPVTILQIGWALGMGLLLGGIFIRTGTILPGIAAHAVNNAADACFLSAQTAGAELIFQTAACAFLLLVGVRTVMHKNPLIYQKYEL